jgi:hypothetical protein
MVENTYAVKILLQGWSVFAGRLMDVEANTFLRDGGSFAAAEEQKEVHGRHQAPLKRAKWRLRSARAVEGKMDWLCTPHLGPAVTARSTVRKRYCRSFYKTPRV